MHLKWCVASESDSPFISEGLDPAASTFPWLRSVTLAVTLSDESGSNRCELEPAQMKYHVVAKYHQGPSPTPALAGPCRCGMQVRFGLGDKTCLACRI